MNIEKLLKELSISDTKISELMKKPHISNNISQIAQTSPAFTRLHYSLACTAPKDVDVKTVSKLIDSGMIKHENMLRGVFSYYEKHLEMPLEEYIRKNDVSKEDIIAAIESKRGKDKPTILRDLKKEMPCADFKIVMEVLNTLPTNTADNKPENKPARRQKDERFGWLEEGEISLLSTPQNNKQANDEILRSHLERTGGKVVTRFPPEPNGNLHIGHAKAINLNFNYAEKHEGKIYLRFDDTNPRNEKKEHYDSILEDIQWLGFKPDKITASSDYNDFMNEKSLHLIKNGKAYVCHCSLEDIRNRRQIFQKERDEGRFDPTILSPYRNRSVEENLLAFQQMLDGKFADGEAVLRFKMDVEESRNPMMLDLVGSRVINMEHPGKGRNWHVYPSYEFALCVADSLEDVTHSFCSREFLTRQESYHWLLRNLGMYEPIQWEFSRLNLSNTVLSKRKMNELVKRGLGWDDPRLFTIKGMRRRGFTAEAINRFVRSVGVTFSESVVDVKILENFVRMDLDRVARRVFCLRKPLKVTVTNLNKRKVEIPAIGKVEGDVPLSVEVKKVIYIEEDDFCTDTSNDDSFMRLTPAQPVGLIGLGTIKFVEKTNDGIVCELCEEEPKKHIQWLADLNNKVTLRMYRPLFRSFNPDEVGYLNDLDMESCEAVTAYCDYRVKGVKPLDKFQFVRIGFFCCDYDSKDNDLVFNLTLPLKSSF